MTVAAPDGRKVLPVFTSVTALQTWDAAARPVPADGRRTALAAASEDTELIVIDPASETEFVIRRPAVWAIAQGESWEPAHTSPAIFTGLQESISGELAVLDLAVESGDPPAACVVPNWWCTSSSCRASSRRNWMPCSPASHADGRPTTASRCWWIP